MPGVGVVSPPAGGVVSPPVGGVVSPPVGGVVSPPVGGVVSPPVGGVVSPPVGGVVSPPGGGVVSPPVGGVVSPPVGGVVSPPVGGVVSVFVGGVVSVFVGGVVSVFVGGVVSVFVGVVVSVFVGTDCGCVGSTGGCATISAGGWIGGCDSPPSANAQPASMQMANSAASKRFIAVFPLKLFSRPQRRVRAGRLIHILDGPDMDLVATFGKFLYTHGAHLPSSCRVSFRNAFGASALRATRKGFAALLRLSSARSGLRSHDLLAFIKASRQQNRKSSALAPDRLPSGAFRQASRQTARELRAYTRRAFCDTYCINAREGRRLSKHSFFDKPRPGRRASSPAAAARNRRPGLRGMLAPDKAKASGRSGAAQTGGNLPGAQSPPAYARVVSLQSVFEKGKSVIPGDFPPVFAKNPPRQNSAKGVKIAF